MSALIVLTLVIGAPALYLVVWISNSKFRNAINKFPGPPTAPLVGNALQVGKGSAAVYRQFVKWAAEYKEGVHRIWLGPNPVINIYKAELLDCIFSTSNSKKSKFYKFLRPWLQDGLLNAFGSKWQKRRKMLTPTFHYSILEDFMSVFHQQSEKLVRILKEKKENEEFDIYPYITRCALDVLCSTAMGVDLNVQESQSGYIDAINRISELIISRISNVLSFYDPVYNLTTEGKDQKRVLNILHGFTRKVISERWREYEEKLVRGEKLGQEEFDEFGKKKRLALLDLLVQNSMADQSMTITDIQEEVDTFMFAGHDTTTSAVNWTIYNLAKHPTWQDKIREEILQISENGSCPSMKQVSELKLLDCFLKESIRVFTTVPFISREVSEECYIGPYLCPGGTTIVMLLSALHRDPRYFPGPDKFDPERWMLEDISKRHPFCYVPFSSGLRNCIGQKFAMLEWKVTLINLLKNFYISCEQDLNDLKDQRGEVVLRPTNALNVKLQRRECNQLSS